MWPTSVVMPVLVTRIVAGAAGDLGVHERQVDPVAERGIRRRRRRPAWARARSRRSAPTRRSRASPRVSDAAVGRHEVAGLDVHDVARHELLHRHLRASSPSRRTLALTIIIFWRAATLASALPSWLRPMAALKQGQADEHDAGRDLVRDEQAEDAGRQQDDLHRVLVLAHERLPARLLRRPRRTGSVRTWRGVSPPRHAARP